MPPMRAAGVALADGLRLVGGVRDVLAADRVDGGVEGVQEEDDDQQRHADDGDDGAGDQRRPGVAGEPLAGGTAAVGVLLCGAGLRVAFVRAVVCRAAVIHAVKPIGRTAPPAP